MTIIYKDELIEIGRVKQIQDAILAPYTTPQAQDSLESSQIQDALALIKDCSNRVIKYAIEELNIELDDRQDAE